MSGTPYALFTSGVEQSSTSQPVLRHPWGSASSISSTAPSTGSCHCIRAALPDDCFFLLLILHGAMLQGLMVARNLQKDLEGMDAAILKVVSKLIVQHTHGNGAMVHLKPAKSCADALAEDMAAQHGGGWTWVRQPVLMRAHSDSAFNTLLPSQSLRFQVVPCKRVLLTKCGDRKSASPSFQILHLYKGI